MIEQLLDTLDLHNVSDIFLTENKIPHLRINAEITPYQDALIPAESVTSFRKKVLSEQVQKNYEKNSSADTAYLNSKNQRFRLNFYESMEGPSIAIRPIRKADELDFQSLSLPDILQEFSLARHGLVLICGATGSGKSTTLAAMVNCINCSLKKHILTIEDPIEYQHSNKSSIVSQCDLSEGGSFDLAVRNAMRKNPDVIVIGEMRDAETAQAAVNAALTGHLVLSTVHTGNAILAVERIINLFPEDQRQQLATDIGSSLLGIVAQRLLPRPDDSGMIPAVECLPATPMVKKLISRSLFTDLEGILREGTVPGMKNFQRALFEMYQAKLITSEMAWEYADNRDELKLLFEGLKSGVDTFRKVYGEKQNSSTAIDMASLLYNAVKNGSSDLILTTDTPPGIRIDGKIHALDLPPLKAEDTSQLLYGILTPHQRIEFEEKRELDIALSLNLKKRADGSIMTGRFRVNAFHQRGSVGIVARVINTNIPEPATLGIPPVLMSMALKNQGLFLVTGPTGSGKSTTLAALVDYINKKRHAHIITIEDPIEFVHSNKRSIIEQRELHADTLSYSCALRNALRQDPDVILVGEMRDTETMAAAITAAETGHLVLATIHTNNAPQTIDRIVDSFPDHQQNQIRMQLAGVLLGVVSQRLLPLKDNKGRVAVFEIMTGTSPIQALIREGKTHLLRSSIETGYKDGMITMERALKELAEKNIVLPEEIAKISC